MGVFQAFAKSEQEWNKALLETIKKRKAEEARQKRDEELVWLGAWLACTGIAFLYVCYRATLLMVEIWQ